MNISKKIITAVLASTCLMGTVLLPAESIPFNNTAISVSAATAPSTGWYKIKCDALRIRKSPGTNSTPLGQIPNGEKVKVTRVVFSGTDYWGYTSYKGVSGYICMATSYVVKTTEP
jgi:uncharacterized protein YgiM (DUF1202 family)